MLSRWSDVLFADIFDAICEVMALYRMAFVFWGVVGTIRWTFAVRVNGRTVTIMDELAKTVAGLLEQYSGIYVILSIVFSIFFIVMFIAAFVFIIKQFKDMDDDFKKFKRW